MRFRRRATADIRTMAALFAAAEEEAARAGEPMPAAVHLLLAALGLPEGSARRAFERAGGRPRSVPPGRRRPARRRAPVGRSRAERRGHRRAPPSTWQAAWSPAHDGVGAGAVPTGRGRRPRRAFGDPRCPRRARGRRRRGWHHRPSAAPHGHRPRADAGGGTRRARPAGHDDVTPGGAEPPAKLGVMPTTARPGVEPRSSRRHPLPREPERRAAGRAARDQICCGQRLPKNN